VVCEVFHGGRSVTGFCGVGWKVRRGNHKIKLLKINWNRAPKKKKLGNVVHD